MGDSFNEHSESPLGQPLLDSVRFDDSIAYDNDESFMNDRSDSFSASVIGSMRRFTRPVFIDHPLLWVLHALWQYCLEASFVLQSATVTLVELVRPSAFYPGAEPPSLMLTISLISIQLLESFIVIVAVIYTFHRMALQMPKSKRLWQTYLSVIMGFAGFFFTLMLISPNAFNLYGLRDERAKVNAGTRSPIQIMLACLYFSTATMSLTGFGDIFAKSFVAQLLTALQMSLGVMYSVGIFAVAYSHFHGSPSSVYQHSNRDRNCLQRALKYLRNNVKGIEAMRLLIIRNILFVTLLGAFAECILLWIFGDAKSSSLDSVLISLACVQAILTAIIFGMSVRLVHKISLNHVKMSYLVQSYLSTSILFGGAYLVVYVSSTSSFHFEDKISLAHNSGLTLVELVWRFNYFSLATMTTTGFGDLYPVEAGSRMLVALHMVVAAIYHITIVGLGLTRISVGWSWIGASTRHRRHSHNLNTDLLQ